MVKPEHDARRIEYAAFRDHTVQMCEPMHIQCCTRRGQFIPWLNLTDHRPEFDKRMMDPAKRTDLEERWTCALLGVSYVSAVKKGAVQ